MMQPFETYLQGKGLSYATIKEYGRHVALFTAWYGGDDMINCEKKDILEYLNHLNNRGVKVDTRYVALLSLRHYFNALTNENLTASNPTALIKLRGLYKRRLLHIYTPEELTELVDAYYLLCVKNAEENLTLKANHNMTVKSYFAQLRNYTMLQFFAYQGLSTKEVINLQVSDIQLQKAVVSIPEGTQTGNARTLPLHATQIGVIIQYLQDIRPYLVDADGSLLFLPVMRAVWSQADNGKKTLENLLYNLKRIDRNFTNFPQLRASVITSWIKACGLRKAQYMAGHRDISTTERYLPNCIEDLAEDMTRFNPF